MVIAERLMTRPGIAREAVCALAGLLLIILGARVQIPLEPVPLTGQTFAVLLTGALLGARRGALTTAVYLLLGISGLPVFAGGAAGIGRLLGPSGGYLIGFIAAAWLTGCLAERGWDRRLSTAALSLLIGNAAIYLCGLPWLSLYVGRQQVIPLGLAPFILGDLIKIGLATLALPPCWRLLRP